MDTPYEQSNSSVLDLVSKVLFAIAAFLAPIFFIPSLSVPIIPGRFVVIGTLLLLSFVAWAIARLKDGIFEMPRAWLYVFIGAFLVAYVLSAFFSGNMAMSFSGQAYEIGTVGSLFIAVLGFVLASLLLRKEKDVSNFFVVLLVSAILLALHQTLRLFFGANVLSFGLLGSKAENLLGRWNDLGVFFGAIVLATSVILDSVKTDKVLKIVSWIAFAFSVFLLVTVNFSSVWITLAALSLALLVYTVLKRRKEDNKKLPILITSVLVLSLACIFVGDSISTSLSQTFGVSHVEVRPSWSATMDIASKSLAHNPVFGTGPNRFSSQWLLSKPDGINGTLFWGVDFNQGIGFIPTLAVTTGLLGIITLLAFVVVFAFTGFKSIFSDSSNGSGIKEYLLPSFATSVFLWVFAFAYSPSFPIMLLTFVSSGVFLAILSLSGVIQTLRISTINSSIKGFVSVLLLIVAILGSAAFGYSMIKKTLASSYFQQGVIAVNRDGNLDKGEQLITKAIATHSFDLYNRFLSDLYLVRVNSTLNDKTLDKAAITQKFQKELGVAIQSARTAINLDPTDYQNYVSLGRTYESVVPLGIQGSYESAKTAYKEAVKLNPSNPQLYLFIARLELAHGDRAEARKQITASLGAKRDYADSIFLLSQIEIAEGRLAEALSAVEAVAILSPNDPGVFFQLGLLRYNNRDWNGSAQAFNRAVEITPVYANAKYFLGLSLYQLGDKEGAIKQFADLNSSNPDNTEISTILANLQADKAPFQGATDNKPEKRSTLPVKDTTSN